MIPGGRGSAGAGDREAVRAGGPDLGINEGTVGNWVNADKRHRGEGDGALGEDERAITKIHSVDRDLFGGRKRPASRSQIGSPCGP